MPTSTSSELRAASAQILRTIAERVPANARLVFVSGNFNTLHPGHLRLLRLAADIGNFLVVGVNPDGHEGVFVAEALRLEAVEAISLVDFAFILRDPVPSLLRALKPFRVVKGKEHERLDNPELAVLAETGGKLVFSSGEMRFSSLDLLGREMRQFNPSTIALPGDFPQRHGFAVADCLALVPKFAGLRALVIGDVIVDQYITCDALGMSQEDPTIVVTPVAEERFLGGAGIVAGHAAGLGAEVRFLSVVGRDECGAFASDTLDELGVHATLLADADRPTTEKQRFRSAGKTLLRVNRLTQAAISRNLQAQLFAAVEAALGRTDVVVFSDFNYGCLPQELVERIAALCTERGIIMLADSQSSSQIGDVSRFPGMAVLTPTEREARLAVQNFNDGLVVLVEALRAKARSANVLLTLGAEGVLVQAAADNAAGFITDRLPALNTAAKDVAGAGDSMLATVALALASGADIWRATYLGSVSAACQVGRVGNLPLKTSDLERELALGER